MPFRLQMFLYSGAVRSTASKGQPKNLLPLTSDPLHPFRTLAEAAVSLSFRSFPQICHDWWKLTHAMTSFALRSFWLSMTQYKNYPSSGLGPYFPMEGITSYWKNNACPLFGLLILCVHTSNASAWLCTELKYQYDGSWKIWTRLGGWCDLSWTSVRFNLKTFTRREISALKPTRYPDVRS